MRSFENLTGAYQWCMTEGGIIPQEEVDPGKVIANIKIAEEDLLTAQDSVSKKRWNSAYKTYYDVLHQLVEAFLSFERVKVKTHLCLFAYLCHTHPELELSWDFFENVRTRRNGIQYYGTPVTEQDWKKVGLQFALYIKLFKKEIEKRLKMKEN